MIRHFVDVFDLQPHEARALIDRALALKREDREGKRPAILAGRTLGLVFEKPSLRTRVSFEAAIAQLGGNAIFLQGKDVGLGSRESAADFARITSLYIDALAVRTFAHATVEELARHASIPVINALSDAAHPCQALADMMTIRESLGRLEGVKVAFVGDGNNVAGSLAQACALLGLEFVLAAPAGYEFTLGYQTQFARAFPGTALRMETDARQAVARADVVYTDVWASMGQEGEADARRRVFEPFRVDDGLLALAHSDAIFLHCLPAHRGEEVTAEVIDGPKSRVLLQAANRLHFQKALLVWLLCAGKPGPTEVKAKVAPEKRPSGSAEEPRAQGPKTTSRASRRRIPGS
ncbi:MAG TPA: ornithine carbamoyltransferase [Isosphaeraceae bacterium]|nr:ornithine carbamoyltransferase [Isosphaeraceae bacterium]